MNLNSIKCTPNLSYATDYSISMLTFLVKSECLVIITKIVRARFRVLQKTALLKHGHSVAFFMDRGFILPRRDRLRSDSRIHGEITRLSPHGPHAKAASTRMSSEGFLRFPHARRNDSQRVDISIQYVFEPSSRIPSDLKSSFNYLWANTINWGAKISACTFSDECSDLQSSPFLICLLKQRFSGSRPCGWQYSIYRKAKNVWALRRCDRQDNRSGSVTAQRYNIVLHWTS